MRLRTLLVPGVLCALAACAQNRKTTQVTPPTATATGTNTGTAPSTGYGNPSGNAGGDKGAAVPTDQPIVTTSTPPPNNETINGSNAGFPDPTQPPNNTTTAPPTNTTPTNTPPNNWTGAQDEIGTAPWAITSLDPATKVASDGTVTTPGAAAGATDPNANAATGATGATAVTYDGKVAQILNANCVNGCHVAGGSRPGSPMDNYTDAKFRADTIVSRANGGGMPPKGPMAQADIDALKAWQAGGFLQAAPSGGGNGGGTTNAGQGPTLEITDKRYGNYLNETKVTGKVGQTLKIVNKRSTGFTIHTNGAPFPHGNEIAPGSSQDYRLEAPYQGEGDIYEHTDGSVNTDRLIKLEVTP